MTDPVPHGEAPEDAPEEGFEQAFRELFRRFFAPGRSGAPEPSGPSSPTDTGDTL